MEVWIFTSADFTIQSNSTVESMELYTDVEKEDLITHVKLRWVVVLTELA